jgi:hypothetical protein
LRIEQGHATEQSRAWSDFAEHIQFQAAIALLALHRKHPGGQFPLGLVIWNRERVEVKVP